MTIRAAINQLQKAAELVGDNTELAVVRVNFGENDYVIPSYVVTGIFEDQDGNEFKCAMVGESGGEEFTKIGVPHYEWKSEKDKVQL